MGKAKNNCGMKARQRKRYERLTTTTVDVQNNTVDVQNNTVDVQNNTVDVQNNTVDVQNNTVDVQNNDDNYASSLAIINTLQVDRNEWREAFINSGNSDIFFLLEITEDLLDNRNVAEYEVIFNKIRSHFPNGIPKVNVYIPGFGFSNDILNEMIDRLEYFVNNHPKQKFSDAVSRGEEKFPELISSDPMRICV